MGEKILRFMVNEVNKLLGTDYNMISFDSLSKNGLIQVCADCLTKLDALSKLDVERNTDDSLTKILDILANIKVPIPQNLNVNEFTDGIIQGKRSIIHPTLHWILSNQNDVKKRAYFARYLKKVPIPIQMTSDPDIQGILLQYERLIQDFKAIHQENTKFAKMGAATLELRKEIEKMTNDLTKIQEQIEKQKLKVDNIPNKESLMVAIKSYRNEVIQDKTLQKQLEDQKEVITKLEIKIKKMNEVIQRKKALRLGPDGLISKLQEEVQTNRVLVEERLPQELSMLKTQAELIEIVATESPPSQTELEDLQTTVDNSSLEVQKMLESTLINNDPRDDKLAQFRQHVTVIANNKQIAADGLLELKDEVNIMRRKVEEKENILHNTIGGSMPQGEELKKFVSKLRSRSLIYKERRAQLLEAQAEIGVLTRTLDILKKDNFALSEALQSKNTETAEETPEEKNMPETPQALLAACKDFIKQINNKRAETVLIRQDLHSHKITVENLTINHAKAKEIYDSSMSNFNAEIKRLEDQVKKLENEIEEGEKKWKNFTEEIERKEDILSKLSEDVSNFGEQKKTQTDILNEMIQQQEDIKKELLFDLQQTMAEKEEREQQMILWYSTLELMKCRLENLDI